MSPFDPSTIPSFPFHLPGAPSDPQRQWTYLDSAPRPSPAHPVSVSADGAELTMTTEKESDWYRTPEWEKRTGPSLGVWRRVTFADAQGQGQGGGGELRASVELEVDHRQQATLLLYLSPTCWVKAGLEFDDGQLFAGCVVSNPYSDWSIQPSPSHSIRISLVLSPTDLKVYLGPTMIREVRCFGPYARDVPVKTEGWPARLPGAQRRVWVGVMGCSPKGEGVVGRWRGFRLQGGEAL